jgi:hypothetical protein
MLSLLNVLYVCDRAIEREPQEVGASRRGKIRDGEYFGKMKKGRKERKRRMNESERGTEEQKKGNEKGSISK